MSAPLLDAHRCLTQVMATRLRVTRLHADGSLDPGTENLYVTDSLISIASAPDVLAATVITQKNGSGNVCMHRRSDDQTLAYNLTMNLCQLDEELIEMLTGATLVTKGGVTVGLQRPKVGTSKPAVCVEAWAEARTAAEQAVDDAGNLLWKHWIWPHVKWTPGTTTIDEAAQVIPLTGYAEENESMGTGPAGDWPALYTASEGWFTDSAIPAASCGYQSLVIAGSGS